MHIITYTGHIVYASLITLLCICPAGFSVYLVQNEFETVHAAEPAGIMQAIHPIPAPTQHIVYLQVIILLNSLLHSVIL